MAGDVGDGALLIGSTDLAERLQEVRDAASGGGVRAAASRLVAAHADGAQPELNAAIAAMGDACEAEGY